MAALAIVVVDVQNDFIPDGNLAVPGGDQVIPVINHLLENFRPKEVFLTRDTHPTNHGSFASNHKGKKPFDVIKLSGIQQVLWPAHCVKGTKGAKIVSTLEVPDDAAVIDKGMDPKYDSYSGFKDAGGKETTLSKELSKRGVKSEDSILYVCGLATDYCVKATALDAVEHYGFKVRVVIDACRGVSKDTTEKAIEEMVDAGVEFVRSEDPGTPVDPLS